MSLETQRARLTWRSRRGMLELDLILSRFVSNSIPWLSAEQLAAYERLLENTDPDLFNWLMGYQSPTDKECKEIVTYIRDQDNIKTIT